jgi:hypothetical protein
MMSIPRQGNSDVVNNLFCETKNEKYYVYEGPDIDKFVAKKQYRIS